MVPKGFLLTPEKRHIDPPPAPGTLLRVTDRGALLSFVFGNDSPIKMIFLRKKLSKNTSQNEVRSKTSSSYLFLKKKSFNNEVLLPYESFALIMKLENQLYF